MSKPHASRSASGMYFEFLLRRAHSRRRVERMYWSGVSLYSLTTCSKDVMVGTTGPIGSGLPQLGFPRRFAMLRCSSLSRTCGTAAAQVQQFILPLFGRKAMPPLQRVMDQFGVA